MEKEKKISVWERIAEYYEPKKKQKQQTTNHNPLYG
jgi:hypothetical protein